MADGITDSMDVSLSKLWELVKDKKAWSAAVHGVTKSRTRFNDCTTTISPKLKKPPQQQNAEERV